MLGSFTVCIRLLLILVVGGFQDQVTVIGSHRVEYADVHGCPLSAHSDPRVLTSTRTSCEVLAVLSLRCSPSRRITHSLLGSDVLAYFPEHWLSDPLYLVPHLVLSTTAEVSLLACHGVSYIIR